MRRALIPTLAVFAGAMAFLTLPADAQALRYCKEKNELLTEVQQQFNEFVVFSAKNHQGTLLLTRADDGSWTLIEVVGPRACIIATGRQSEFDRGV